MSDPPPPTPTSFRRSGALALRTFMVAATFAACACDSQNTAKPGPPVSDLDGVYASLPSFFDRETLVIDGDRFHWWFSSDTPQPDVFPLSGTVRREAGRLELIYEIPASELADTAYVFPPESLVIDQVRGIPVFRSVRFSDPFHDGPAGLLMPSTLKITHDRSDYPLELTDRNTSPEVWKAIRNLEDAQLLD